MRLWSDQQILDALVAWTKKHGRTPGWNDWKHAGPDHPTAVTVWLRCGSWTEALVLAGLEPNEKNVHAREKKFSRPKARELRRQGVTDIEIARRLGVHHSAIGKVLGPRPKTPRKPRTAAERREARIAALKKAIEKNG